MPKYTPQKPGHQDYMCKQFINHCKENFKLTKVAKNLMEISKKIESDEFSIDSKRVNIPSIVDEFNVKFEQGPKGDLIFKIEMKWFEDDKKEYKTSGDLLISG